MANQQRRYEENILQQSNCATGSISSTNAIYGINIQNALCLAYEKSIFKFKLIPSYFEKLCIRNCTGLRQTRVHAEDCCTGPDMQTVRTVVRYSLY